MPGCKQFLIFSRFESTPLITQSKSFNAMTTKIWRCQRTTPMLGNMTSRQDFQSAQLGLPRIESLHSARSTGRSHKNRSWINKVDSLTASAIRHEALAPFIECMPPWVNQTLHKYFRTLGLWAIMPHSTTE